MSGKMESILLERIVERIEASKNDWRMVPPRGSRSLRIQQELYDQYGKQNILRETVKLEALGLVKAKWMDSTHSDVEKIQYELEQRDTYYRMLDRIPKAERMEGWRNTVDGMLRRAQTDWLRCYLAAAMERIERGSVPDALAAKGMPACLEALDRLQNPVYKRIFSKHVLKDSKAFERELETRVLSIARKYHGSVEDNMDDSQVLSQLFIEEYSQELAIKGELRVEVDERTLDLSAFPYGTVLNSAMLKAAGVCRDQNISRIITVENKANFMSMPYEPGALILFCHGYFSPKEREFLKQLEQVLQDRQVVYLHTGDLDYGGIQIFSHIKKHVFPKLEPLHMDVETFERYRTEAMKLEPEARKRLEKLKEPMLEPLIAHILETGLVIEQESFLFGEG